jgi:hypothetical protein
LTSPCQAGINDRLGKRPGSFGLLNALVRDLQVATLLSIGRMKQGITEIPGKNPGGSSPDSSFSFDDVKCISGDYFRRHVLKEQASQSDAKAATPYKEWIESLPPHLSKIGQQIIDTRWVNLLSDVYNCGAAHTKLFGPDVDHTRRDHCIHAGYVARQVAERALINLTDHEKTVLELVMLLHDPHRLGSHALDRVIASIPGAPDIHAWGWGEDFHEYHGAQEIYRDSDLKEILGVYWADVLAVLSYPDKRSPDDPSRIKDFGRTPPELPANHPPLLPKERINLLYRLKDEIDRMSYLELDFKRSGFDPSLIAGLQQCIEDYQEHFVTAGNHLAVLLPQRKQGAAKSGHESYPFDPWIGARQLHRENIATHPTACLVDAVLRESLTTTVQNHFTGAMHTPGCYKFVRNIALKGDYHKLFGTSVLELLTAPRAAQATLGLEDLYAPLVTLTADDLAETGGRNTLGRKVDTTMSAQICGFPRADMTQLEYDLRAHLRSKGLDNQVLVILSNDFEKILDFKVVEGPEHLEKQQFIDSLRQHGQGSEVEALDVVRFAVRTSSESQKLIIAMKALDDSGSCRNLLPVQEEIRRFFISRGLLKEPTTLVTSYNHRAFCEPLVPQIFRTDVQKRMADFQPAWVTRGGCGLKLS